MAGNYLKHSRHGSVLYFRRRVPDDLRAYIGKPYLTKTLGTGTRKDAIILAREYAVRTDNLFRQIRTMSKNDQTPGMTRVNYDFSYDVKNMLIKVKDAKPEDQAAIDSHIATTLQNLAGVQTAPSASVPVPASGITIMQVWDKYKAVMLAKGTQDDAEGGWKNPNRVNVEQFVHVKSFIDHIGGDRPIVDVTKEDVASFRTYVLTTPDITSAGSRKTRLNRSGALFKYAKSSGRIIPDDFADLFKFSGKIKKNPFLKFSAEDLKSLFESDA